MASAYGRSVVAPPLFRCLNEIGAKSCRFVFGVACFVLEVPDLNVYGTQLRLSNDLTKVGLQNSGLNARSSWLLESSWSITRRKEGTYISLTADTTGDFAEA